MPDYLYCLKYTLGDEEVVRCECMTHDVKIVNQTYGEFMRDFDWKGCEWIDQVFMETWKLEDNPDLGLFGQYKLESTLQFYKHE